MLDKLMTAVALATNSLEELREWLLEDKPSRMTALVVQQHEEDGDHATLLRISPKWGDHDGLMVVLRTEPLGTEYKDSPIKPEHHKSYASQWMPVHLDPDNPTGFSVCGVSHIASEVTQQAHPEPLSLTELLGWYGISLVTSEDDMLADEEGLQA